MTFPLLSAAARAALPALLAVAALLPSAAAAQSDRRAAFDAAYKLYEAGDCAGALQTLRGLAGKPSPRVESLRGLCLYAKGDLVEARVAFHRYQQLLPPAQQASPGHEAVQAVIAELDADLRRADDSHAATLQQRRLQQAEAAAARTRQRLQEQAQKAAASSAQQLMALYARTPDKQAFDASLRDALPKGSLEQVQSLVKTGAAQQSAQAIATLKDLLAQYQGRTLPFHIFPQPGTQGMNGYLLEQVGFDKFTIDYRTQLEDRQGRRLKESGTISGVDLAKVGRYSVSDEGAYSVHLFEFPEARIWRRGGGRYVDGGAFPPDLTSSQGDRELRILLPASERQAAQSAFNALIQAAKAAKVGG